MRDRSSPLLEALEPLPRLLIEARLEPVQGVRFQPAGFPDLGPALFPDPRGFDRLLVESSQSMANHLEAVVWDNARLDVLEALSGLSYVRVLDGQGAFLTSSILEPHRLDSPYVLQDGQVRERLTDALRIGDASPVSFDRRKLPDAVFSLDVGALIHGLFLQSVSGNLRIPRALGGFIEALDARPVTSGGVKRDILAPAGSAREGFGQVLFYREEFVAKEIRAFFSLDLGQIRGYRLARSEAHLVVLVALYKVRAILDRPLRLRAACDLERRGPIEVRPKGLTLPELDELGEAIGRFIPQCPRLEVLEVRYHPGSGG